MTTSSISIFKGCNSDFAYSNKFVTQTTVSTALSNVPGLSTTIAPSSSSNQVLILAQVITGASTAPSGDVTITRNGSNLSNASSPGSRLAVMGGAHNNPSTTGVTYNHFIAYLDSPSTTSQTTYTMQSLNQTTTELQCGASAANIGPNIMIILEI